MKPVRIVVLLMLLTTIHAIVVADETFRPLEQEVVAILSETYPDAHLAKDEHVDSIRTFTAKLRRFVIYRLNKIGDWQEPFDVKAPDRGGISVRFYVREGQWLGALLIPHSGTKDLHVFKETHIVRNSSDRAWHIWAEILTPSVDSPEETKNKLMTVFNDFENYRRVRPPVR